MALKIKIKSTASYKERKLGAKTQLGDETNSVGFAIERQNFLTTLWGDVRYMIERQKSFPSSTPKTLSFKLMAAIWLAFCLNSETKASSISRGNC